MIENFKKHKATTPLLVISVIVSLAVYVFLVNLCNMAIGNIAIKNTLNEILSEEEWIIEIIRYYGGYAIIIVILVIIIIAIRCLYKLWVTAIAYDIRVSEKQFPELYEFEKECAKKLGIKKLPRLYINASCTEEERAKASEIENAHLLRIDYLEVYNSINDNYNVAKFTIARKLAAIYLGDYNILKNFLILFSYWIPILSQLNNRVAAYNCDKLATCLLGKEVAIKSLIARGTGFYITSFVKEEEYLKNVAEVVNEKDVILENLFLDIPLTVYRIEAIMKGIDGRLF